ncbi:MAG TPA: hypothetical protein VIP70_04865 [Nitrososphaeraceae archaeon]|jgi:hypothetical protein
MIKHGDYNPELNQWYCGYWMTKDEWMDIHHYSPPNISDQKGEDDNAQELL